MTHGTEIPTLEDIEDSKKAMDDIQSITYSPSGTFVDAKGTTRKTINGIVDPVDAAAAQGLIDIAADVDDVDNAADAFDANAIDRLNDLDAAYVFTAINNGVWAEFETFTALNQYMVFTGGTAYKPKNSTTLPYIVGASPDTNFVEVVANLSTAQGDARYSREFDILADAIAADDLLDGFPIKIKESGPNGGDWDVVLLSSITPNGDNKFASTGGQLPALGLFRRDAQVIAKNTADYASLGANLAGAISLIAHIPGTAGMASTSVTVEVDKFYQVFVDITTTAGDEGFIKILFDGQEVIFGDQSEGFWFSDVTVLNDGTENNRLVTDNEYYFALQTSSTAFSTLSIETDLNWGGTITTIEVKEVTPTEKGYQLLSTDGEARDNNIGIGTTGVFRGEIFIGDKATGGTMSFDGESPTPAFNVAVGSRALAANFKGDENTGLGTFTLQGNEGSNNVAAGYSALKLNNKGQENSSFGYKSGIRNTTGFKNAFFGFFSGAGVQTGKENCHFGWHPNIVGGEGSFNSYFGSRAGSGILLGERNVAIGSLATITFAQTATLVLNETVGIGAECKPFGDGSIAIGYQAKVGVDSLFVIDGVAIGHGANTLGDAGVSVGRNASAQGALSVAIGETSLATGSRAVAIGESASAPGEQTTVVGSLSTPAGDNATAFGFRAGNNYTGTSNTFVGHTAGLQEVKAFSNVSILGALAVTTASNQVQLGDSATTVFAFGAVQDRSDARDKLDIKDLTDAHIAFFMDIEWKQYRMDYRESYREIVESEGENGELVSELVTRPQDGSRAGVRFHIGAVAQQVEAAMLKHDIDFAGLQHHSVKGGDDVYSIGYQEFIGIQGLIIQRQQASIDSILSRLTAAGI